MRAATIFMWMTRCFGQRRLRRRASAIPSTAPGAGRPAVAAPATAIAAARAALSSGPLGYTETLGIASLLGGASPAPTANGTASISILPGSSLPPAPRPASCWLSWRRSRPATAWPWRYPAIHPIGTSSPRSGCEPVGIETTASARWSLTGEALLALHRARELKGIILASPANPNRHDDHRRGAGELIRCAEEAGIAVISDEIYHGLDYAFAAETAARIPPGCHRRQLVFQKFPA